MLNWKEVLRLAESGNHQPDRKVSKSDDQWRAQLTADQFRVARQSGTERPFSHASCQRFEPGIYQCVCCQQALFDSREKFDSGTGWPSFTQPIQNNSIAYQADHSHGMVRVEATCNVCDAHLGHVFPDGPPPSGLRFCINGIVLEKASDSTSKTSEQARDVSDESVELGGVKNRLAQVTFGGGCFWCTEAIFQRLRGVHRVESGYSGGDSRNPTYEDVCSGATGHAEVIQVTYDPAQIAFSDLISVHLCTHDPTTLNRQGADRGTQYRSIIFFSSPAERQIAVEVKEAIESAIGRPVVTELQPFERFYPAEEGHQNYFNRNQESGYCAAVIEPKLGHLRSAFKRLLVE